RLSFLESVAILLRQLQRIGHGEMAVTSGPGESTAVDSLLRTVEDEIFAIAARYDERNGTTAVSDRARARLDRMPLLDQLSLGPRAVLLPAAPPSPSAEPGRSIVELVAAAEALEATRHPHARQAWQRVAESSAPLEPRVRARIVTSEALAH